VCNADSFCCNQAQGDWDYWCVDYASGTCGLGCGAALPGCAQQYGNMPGVTPCTENPATCQLGFNNKNQSCNSVCGQRGGECVGTFNNTTTTCGVSWGESLGCDHTGYNSAICICSRGCGIKPACGSPQSCDDGVCE
jgi:hypothetical protein